MMKDRILRIKNLVTGKIFRIASWRYWEIVDYLRTEGLEQQESYDASLWATKAKSGETYNVKNYILVII